MRYPTQNDIPLLRPARLVAKYSFVINQEINKTFLKEKRKG